jgi:hypothetical protein
VEIGAEATQFPEKEYINGIAVAVLGTLRRHLSFLIRQLCVVSVCARERPKALYLEYPAAMFALTESICASAHAQRRLSAKIVLSSYF